MGWFRDLMGFGRHTGGSRDAFEQYNLYLSKLLPYYDQGMEEMFKSGRSINPYAGSFKDALKPYDEAQQTLNNLPQLLRNSALAGTENSAVSGLAAARAMASRGGLAYSGGAAALAARTAGGIASQQSSALADAMLQGENAKLSFAQAKSAAMMQATGAEAGLADSTFKDELGYRQNLIASLSGMSTSFGTTGLQGQRATADRRYGLLGPILGNFMGV